MSGFPQKFYHAVFWPIRILMGFAHPIVHVRGLENIPDGPAVHLLQSQLVFGRDLGDRLLSSEAAFSAPWQKKSCFRTAVLGWFITKLGAFPVDREANDIHAVKTASACCARGTSSSSSRRERACARAMFPTRMSAP